MILIMTGGASRAAGMASLREGRRCLRRLAAVSKLMLAGLLAADDKMISGPAMKESIDYNACLAYGTRPELAYTLLN